MANLCPGFDQAFAKDSPPFEQHISQILAGKDVTKILDIDHGVS